MTYVSVTVLSSAIHTATYTFFTLQLSQIRSVQQPGQQPSAMPARGMGGPLAVLVNVRHTLYYNFKIMFLQCNFLLVDDMCQFMRWEFSLYQTSDWIVTLLQEIQNPFATESAILPPRKCYIELDKCLAHELLNSDFPSINTFRFANKCEYLYIDITNIA